MTNKELAKVIRKAYKHLLHYGDPSRIMAETVLEEAVDRLKRERTCQRHKI